MNERIKTDILDSPDLETFDFDNFSFSCFARPVKVNHMKVWSFLFSLLFACASGHAQTPIQRVSELNIQQTPAGQISKYWVHVVTDGMSQPIYVPVMVARGTKPGPTLGLTAAIHGNELNGIPIIQDVFKALDSRNMTGVLIGVPGLNPLSINLDQRRFVDGEDLNRNFPGKLSGNRSQQFTKRIFDKIVQHFDFHLDLHTASFGRENSFYVRADVDDDTLFQIASLQNADIILHSKGKPSFGSTSENATTLREEALKHGIYSITLEYGNPQVFQADLISRGKTGVLNTMRWLSMITGAIERSHAKPVICQKSYWIYTDDGGLLDVPVSINQQLKKGERIGVLKNPFGDVIRQYTAPEDGIVIGRSTNPVSMHGGRIIHLGILK